MIEETTIMHLVRPEDLNHHGTLFAGQMAKWLVEAGFVMAARLTGKPEDIVCVRLTDMNFKKSISNGDIVEIHSKIALLGNTSIIVNSEVITNNSAESVVTNFAVFVCVDKDQKPYKHGFVLSPDYIAANNDIYREALKIKKAG